MHDCFGRERHRWARGGGGGGGGGGGSSSSSQLTLANDACSNK